MEDDVGEARSHPSEADQRPIRRVYVGLVAIPLVFVVVLWARDGTDDVFTRILYPSVLLGNGWLLAGLLSQRLPLRTAGWWVFALPTATLAGRLLSWEFEAASRPADPGLVLVALAWCGVVLSLAFLAFGMRRGSVVAVAGFVALYVGAAGSLITGGVMADVGRRQVIGMAGANAALVLIVWILARNVGVLASVQARAEVLALQATTDPLTGTANRRRLDDDLGRLVARARRYGRPLSVILFDLDHFKDINDAHGHDIGDAVLRATADRMGGIVREVDVLGRWGGEEFLLLAPDTEAPEAARVAERCRAALAASPVDCEGVNVRLTASFGVAQLGPDDDARSLMRRADLAMYTAKRQGRDRVVGL